MIKSYPRKKIYRLKLNQHENQKPLIPQKQKHKLSLFAIQLYLFG